MHSSLKSPLDTRELPDEVASKSEEDSASDINSDGDDAGSSDDDDDCAGGDAQWTTCSVSYVADVLLFL